MPVAWVMDSTRASKDRYNYVFPTSHDIALDDFRSTAINLKANRFTAYFDCIVYTLLPRRAHLLLREAGRDSRGRLLDLETKPLHRATYCIVHHSLGFETLPYFTARAGFPG